MQTLAALLVVLGFALAAALLSVQREPTNNALLETKFHPDAMAMLMIHHAVKELVRANPSTVGVVPTPTIAAAIAPGFENDLFTSDVSAIAIRTWLPPSSRIAPAVLAEPVSGEHYGAINIGIVQATGGWKPINSSSTFGTAAQTSGIPVGSLVVLTARL
jgi:hypothetical protein